jgi:hypothetical protein
MSLNVEQGGTNSAKAIPQVDIQKEMEMIQLNKLAFETQILQQQFISNQLDMKSAKVKVLGDIMNNIEGTELKEAIQNQISQLISEIISIKV